MEIKRFSARKVHGYLDFDVEFFKDLSFLIGINGSGKTTVVRTIHSLLAPSLVTLAYTQFEKVSLEIVHDGVDLAINARIDEKGIHLSTNVTREPLTIPKYEPDPSEPTYRRRESTLDYYRSLEVSNAENPVLELIRKLPTPMYLGIERRALIDRVSDDAAYRRIARPRSRGNIFATSLTASLEDAAELASIQFRKIQEKEDQLKDRLRNQMLLRAFEFVAIIYFQNPNSWNSIPLVARAYGGSPCPS